MPFNLGLGLRLGSGGGAGGVALDAATIAYLAAMGASAPTNAAIIKAYDDLVLALKANGHWDKLDYLQLFYTAHTDGEDTLLNLINPTQTGSLVTSGTNPTFAAKAGFTTDGATNYIRTGFIPATVGNKFGVGAAGAFIMYRTHTLPVSSARYRVYIDDGSTAIGIRTLYNGNTRVQCNCALIGNVQADIDGETKYYFGAGVKTGDLNVGNLYSENTYTEVAVTATAVPNPAGAAKDVFIGEANSNGVAGGVKVATYPSFFAAGSGYTEAQWKTGATSLLAILEAYRTAMAAI